MNAWGAIGKFLLEVGEVMINDVKKSQNAYERFSTFSNKRLKSEWQNRKWLSSPELNGLVRVIKERMGK